MNTSETPDIVYGRLLEAAHFGGYAAERVASEFKWLLTDDRWKQAGGGFDDIEKFLAAINLKKYRISIEDRKELAKLLETARASQRVAAKALGVGKTTVLRDRGPDGPADNGKSKKNGAGKSAGGPDGPVRPEWFQVPPQDVTRPAENAAAKQARTQEIADERSVLAASVADIKPSDRWVVHHADIRSWNNEPLRRFDWIITDPPYPKEFLPLYETLAIRAKHWLKDGGLLVAMCGQSYLNQIVEMMSKHLTYYWIAAYLTPGQPKPLRQVNVNTTWKPLLIFTNGRYEGKIFGDVFRSESNEKGFHDWGQSLTGMRDVVSKLALPGESILDPFCGGGATGVAALEHGCLFEGIDIDDESCRISKARLGECLKKGSLV